MLQASSNTQHQKSAAQLQRSAVLLWQRLDCIMGTLLPIMSFSFAGRVEAGLRGSGAQPSQNPSSQVWLVQAQVRLDIAHLHRSAGPRLIPQHPVASLRNHVGLLQGCKLRCHVWCAIHCTPHRVCNDSTAWHADADEEERGERLWHEEGDRRRFRAWTEMFDRRRSGDKRCIGHGDRGAA